MKVKNSQLGAVWQKDKTTFSVFAPYAKVVKVKLFTSDFSDNSFQEVKMAKDKKGIFFCEINGDWNGVYYVYDVDGVETADPYGKAGGADSKRSMVFDSAQTNPEGWEKDSFKAKLPIVWEVHIRDFSCDKSINVKDAGKFNAFVRGVKTPAGNPALIDHLIDLGVTYVQLLPVADFGSVKETIGGYNWGYDPVCYFMPEGSYSTDPHDGFARVRELKRLVHSLHKAGIGVILDVVFNHTYNVKDNPLNICAPDYYYRHYDVGILCNGSACGNETRSEAEMMRKLIIDCVCYYIKEYHIDGFRFDLMGLHDVETMNAVRKAVDTLFPDGRGKDVLIYGEPWYAEPPYGVEGADRAHALDLDARVGMFNDTFRNGVRGKNKAELCIGCVQGDVGAIEAVISGLKGGVSDNSEYLQLKSPTQNVLYTACHDDLTLYDHLCATFPKGDIERMQRMAAFITLSGLGLVFLQAGEEFLRSKGGDDNSYQSGDEVNKLDWTLADKNRATVEYYRGLIALRKNNPAFFDLERGARTFSRLKAPKGAAAYMIGNTLYAFNVTDKNASVKVGGLTLERVCDIERAGVETFALDVGWFTVAAHGVYAAHIVKER